MASKLGYIPHDIKLTANNIQAKTDGNVLYNSPAGFHLANTATAGATTLTVRQLMGGIIFHNPQATGVAVTLPTPALIVAELNGAATNMSLRFSIANVGAGAETIDVTLPAGITAPAQNALNANVEVAAGETLEYILIMTDVTPGNETGTLYCVGVSAGTYA